MIQRSLLALNTEGSLKLIRDCLGILEEDFQIVDDSEISYDFLQGRRNGAFASNVLGDFSYAIDFFGFDKSDEWLRKCLLEISLHGIDVSEPNEEKNGPFDYLLYHNGQITSVEVIEDEETGWLKVNKP